jgi:broad specificity phosphatase PhoE
MPPMDRDRLDFLPMPVLLLVRHGETEWNRERRWQGQFDLPLTPVGEQQSRAIAARLADVGAVAVYSSDLTRARQTADAIALTCGLDVQFDPGLREVDVGSWVGLTSDEAGVRDPAGHARWVAGGTGWTDGETYPAMAERVVRTVREIADRHAARERIVIVAHGGPIRALAAHAVGLAGDGRSHLSAGPNASLTTIDVRPTGWRLMGYNDAGHIPITAEPPPDPAGEPA